MTHRHLSILITGAGSGLGRGLADVLSTGGHRIFVTDQSPERAAETLSMIDRPGGTASAHALDVTRDDSIEAMLRTVGNEPVDVLVNNAGLQHVARLEEFPQEKWDLLIDVMLRGACRMSRAVLPIMRKNSFGRIINIGSIHSLVASSFKTAYVAAKHGLVGLAKVLALETADVDITVNTICPSYIRTPLVDAQIEAQARTHGITPEQVIDQIMLKPMPKRCFITPEEVAATVEFLCTAAARNITGQCIVIDGGWTIQ
ncbi:MAG: 3-hydroxybutyrate dehydrogenase [Planctomycetes bacterium]|nr:3-hydroxybutyrate dehydrogenase [Planctomycetota bacterium]